MANWDERILSAADKISKGIEKGADKIVSINTQRKGIDFQSPQINNSETRSVMHCPSCGRPVGSIDIVCPACGSSLEDTNASSSAQTLAYNLSVIDSQKEGMIRNYIRTHQYKISDKATQKAQMIKAFPVPNTKKDLLEFIHMAASNINTKILLGITEGSSLDMDALKTEKLLSEAWLEKMESIYQKAKTLLSGDADLSKIENVYNAKKHEIEALQEQLKKKSKKSNTWIAIIFALLILGLGAAFFFGIRGERQAKIAKNDTLEALVIEIREDIAAGNYNDALIKTNQIRLKDGSSAEEEAKWDREREKLIKEIEQARDQ